jgi:histone-lysine N-methyltransferase SUV39H
MKVETTKKGKTYEKCMWGLFAEEEIPAGAFVTEYVGEVITNKYGDIRGTHYDKIGSSYLFDMNDPDEDDQPYERKVNQAFQNAFFPFCVDAGLYGNESRFINHCCDPCLRPFTLVVDCESPTYHSIGLFTTRKIRKGEELTLDYKWDKNLLDVIEEDVPCLCGAANCREYLMRAKKRRNVYESTE